MLASRIASVNRVTITNVRWTQPGCQPTSTSMTCKAQCTLALAKRMQTSNLAVAMHHAWSSSSSS